MSVDPMFDLRDRVIVVSGASSGIGASAAACYAERGAKVVLAARRRERIRELAAQLPGASAVVCDVTDDAACADLVSTTLDTFGRIDVLVNNAGTHTIEAAETEAVDSFRKVVETNLVATFALTQAVARPMLEAGSGSVINIASVFGVVGSGVVKQAPYAASKGGVIAMTRELAAQWARRGIRVNAIAPGFFDTEMTGAMFSDEASMRWLQRQTPMGRAGELAELHGALVFLASAASSYVTGVTLPVDGGWTAV